MKYFLIFFLVISSLSIYSQPFSIIPEPVKITATEGYFVFNRGTYIVANDIESFKDGAVFNQFMNTYFQFPVKTLQKPFTTGNYIEVAYNTELNIADEGYILTIENEKIFIQAKNRGGVLHGFMTLFQMFAFNRIYYSNEEEGQVVYKIPCCEITDYPRFQYRGMHLDCARHFFDVAFIKKYIDYLALYKYNSFHWHLTDDQGWRIEIKQYPKLAEVGGWRDGSMVGHYREQQFDSIRYGGYYTQVQIKEVVKYAAERNITVIPEIEMPGHCSAALAAYPELGCVADTTYTVSKLWGVLPEVFCPTEETFTFLENVLDEVMELFPSEYMHIGGDEVEKTRWKNSAFCKTLMHEKNLKDEHELQSYFIQRIAEYVNNKGKKIIGWDEILEGGLAEDATIMSWRGEEGGIAAAQQNHYAIMTPTSHCYFDYYQGSPVNEPLAIGGYIPLEKVYVYEPIPAQLNAQQAKYILGAQANIWTEYITNPDQVEYMAIPRMLALSEVLWSEKGKRDYDAFVQRLLFHFKLLDNINCNYSKSIYKITFSIKPDENYNGIWAYMSSPFENDNFYFAISSNAEQYLMEGTYKNPIAISSSCKVSGVSEKLKPEAKNYNSISISFNKATGKKISLTSPPSKKYAADGAFTLVNGIVATTKPNWAANEWLGFEGTDCETMIDLGKTDTIKKITVGYLEDKLSWIWAAGSVEVFASADGINFMKIDLQTFQKDERNAILSFVPFTTQCIKLKIKNYGDIPSGNPGAGKRAWLFVDEISIE